MALVRKATRIRYLILYILRRGGVYIEKGIGSRTNMGYLRGLPLGRLGGALIIGSLLEGKCSDSNLVDLGATTLFPSRTLSEKGNI